MNAIPKDVLYRIFYYSGLNGVKNMSLTSKAFNDLIKKELFNEVAPEKSLFDQKDIKKLEDRIALQEGNIIAEIKSIFSKIRPNSRSIALNKSNIISQSIEAEKQYKFIEDQKEVLLKIAKEINSEYSLDDTKKLYEQVENLQKFLEGKNFTSITRLDLNKLNLEYLPPEIGNLTQLRDLSLSRNNLQEFPLVIGNLTFLLTLDLSGNNLKELPPKIIEKLPLLLSLDLSGNNLKELPKEIGTLTFLLQLRLSGNNLKELPKEIEKLPLWLTDFGSFRK